LGQTVGIGVDAPGRRDRWRTRSPSVTDGGQVVAALEPQHLPSWAATSGGSRDAAGAGGDAEQLLAAEGQRVDADDLALGRAIETNPVLHPLGDCRGGYLVTDR